MAAQDEIDTSADTLAGLASAAPQDAPEEDPLAALDSLALVEEAPAEDTTFDTLAGLAAAAPVETVKEDALSALGTLTPVAEQDEIDTSADTLAGLASAAPQDAPEEDPLAALDSLALVEEAPAEDDTADTLAGLESAAPQDAPEEDPLAALDSLAPVEETAAEDNTADTLAGLATATPEEAPAEDPLAALDSLAALDAPLPADEAEVALASLETPEAEVLTPPEADDLDDFLADLADDGGLDDLLETPESAPDTAEDGGLDDLLGDLSDDTGLDDLLADPAPQAEAAAEDSLDDLLGDPGTEDSLDDLLAAPEPELEDKAAPSPEHESVADDDLDDLLGGLADDDPLETPEHTEEPADDLGALLGDLADDAAPAVPEAELAPAPSDDLDDLLGDLTSDDGLSDLLDAPEPAAEPQQDTADDDFDDLLGDLAGDAPAAEAAPEAATQRDELDDLLGGLAGDDPLESPEPTPAPVDDLDDLLGDLTTGDGLDDLLADPDTLPETEPALEIARPAEPEFAFGTIAGERPAPEKLNRKRFRMAILGDFSGRAARGLVDTGDGLASRAPMPLDPDTADDLIESFATTLVLPIGKDGTGVEVKLGELDDLHPDELFEKLPLFADLVGLKAQLGAGGTAESAAAKLRQWAEQHGTYAAPARRTSSGNAMPAGKRLTDFQALIGDTSGQLTQPSAIEDLLARVVGPHIRAVPDADAQAMQQAVDQSIAAAMRLILHHPEFQSLEAQWRSIDLIARSIEADDTLDVVLYDVSAEEIATDLARADDLSQSGLARMLTEAPLDEDTGRGGFSAIMGLYTFEETPPHAQILGRIARVAAHVDAPFFGAMAAGTLATDKADRHPLVAEAWDELRGMAEAKYLGLATPRFMLRRPYGAKTEPTYEFDFEEFTMQDGLKSLLWANPVVLVAILLAQSFRANGKGMNLGSVMSLGGIPYHFVTDRHGDQVQLPCTERNLTEKTVEAVMARGLMPVVSIRGRDEIRLASFQALGGGTVLGPWSDVPPPPPTAPKVTAPEPDDAELASDLDDLLAGFDDATPAPADPGDVDAELAALLDGL
ncbi:type VI secretion system contractile sheath domain-containing protein [Arenibacterium halophilum]|uniref:type VI secretion system contractile sheath domain-containing protein n=1 Tax=Arenibacterium halophilum TaxID=2583821 RepID=UPI00319E3AD8